MEEAVDCHPMPRKMMIGGLIQYMVDGRVNCIPPFLNSLILANALSAATFCKSSSKGNVSSILKSPPWPGSY
jgi:hypothetical protein